MLPPESEPDLLQGSEINVPPPEACRAHILLLLCMCLPCETSSSSAPFVRSRLHGVLCPLLAQRFQRAAPCDDLIEHGVDRLLSLGSRLEDAEVLEIGEEGKTDLRFHVGDLQFPHHQSQILHRACP